jgi:hypothetical protein
MPANLNALIRYKQIDLCLKNPYLKATIEVMQEKCSDQLAEHRGIYKQISERTIRDDIRVMRSDAMGFNAPIVVHHGVYSYEDKDYSIFSTSISEMDLLKEVVNLLIQERVNIKSAKLNVLLKELSGITGIKIYEEKKTDGLYSENTQDFKLNNNEIDSIHIKKTSKRKSEIEPKEEKGLNTKYLKLQNSKLTGSSIDLSQFHRPSNSIKKKGVSHIYSWESILEVL